MNSLKYLALLFAGACAVSPSPTTDDSTDIPDGTVGTMRVRFYGGKVHEVSYVARHGHAFWEEDVDLGPIQRNGDRANAIVGIDHRWPGGVIHWKFGDDFSASDQSLIRQAMAEYNLRTPVQFIEGVDPNLPHLTVYFSDEPGISFTSGKGPDSIDAGDETDVHFWPGLGSLHVPLHELGHVLGLTHEQDRADREKTVDFDASCTTNAAQFQVYDDGFEELTPYDIKSIMQYSSSTFCVKDPSGSSTLKIGTNCLCYPIVKKGTSHFSDAGSFAASPDLSAFDIQAVTAMYEPRLGSVEDGDLFGAAMVAGDFDGDGIQDLAVGAPGEAVGATPHTGAVFLYRGTTNGLVAWKSIGELDLAPSTGASGDQFGFSLAAADFDGDGKDDLVIGAPGARGPISAARGGTAWVLYGSTGGPAIHGAFELDQSDLTNSVSETGDRFGAALAVGDLNMDKHPDLAISALHEKIDGEQSGYVNTFTSSGRTFKDLHGVSPPGESFGPSEFGNSLAIADFDDDGTNDLAVGSLGGSGVGPAVYIYHGTRTSFSIVPTASAFPLQTFAGNTFGTSIGVGNFDGKTYTATGHKKPELVVTAPNENQTGGAADDSGRLYLFDPQLHTSGLAMVQLQVIAQGSIPGDKNVFEDELGMSLAVGKLDGDAFDDLVVGVHNKSSGLGMVVTFTGSSSELVGGQTLGWPALGVSGGQLQFPQSGDELGSVVTIGDFTGDGHRDAIGGMPHRNDDGGAIVEYVNSSGVLFPVRYLDEGTASPQ